MHMVAYGYLLRQYRYPDTDKDLLKALIGAIAQAEGF
jgi:hypothetical protein